ncbi:MAG TPA: sigma-70 family RNA polymerase sigma factor [Nocardioides sp.]|jgi:RNA polymerase sigma-70 factor (ECF subfamily)|uniref:sigma-70 family RNA polymerase sigma factor n=1 Tax=Nocardioides sp. TaxID=35761 RepID=UPI002E32168D|nr:sigma-70 family RNA polymerase sigma factor [Nocardioides sp.]HEX3930304.1 sigma-70 family RNA polymerase sigma factor [Nocardioides sp.]
MPTQETLAQEFEVHRTHLRSVAYRMLGSVTEADDAVQEAWLRLARTDTDDVVNLRGWLTTVVSRICLDLLRSRRSRREEPLDFHLPDPVVTRLDADPAASAERADAVTLALLVVLDTLNPRERMAFVLHDMFGVPFDQIGEIVGATPATATQLASRARRRVRATPPPAADLATQRRVLEAFTSAARDGDFDALLEVLDPDVVLRADGGTGAASGIVRGALEVASQASAFRRAGHEPEQTWVLVNGAVGLVGMRDGRPFSVFSPVVRGNRIVEINILVDPERIAAMDLAQVL